MAHPLALAALSLLSLSSPTRAAWELIAGNEVRAFSSSAQHGFLTAQNNAAQAIIQADGNPVSEEERLRGVWAGFGPVPRGPFAIGPCARERFVKMGGLSPQPPHADPPYTHLPAGLGVSGWAGAGGRLAAI